MASPDDKTLTATLVALLLENNQGLFEPIRSVEDSKKVAELLVELRNSILKRVSETKS